MTAWARYVGLPRRDGGRDWDGVDCWGLYRLVIGTETGVWLPRYDQDEPVPIRNRRRVSHTLRAGLDSGPWQRVDAAEIGPLDLLVFRLFGLPLHVACAVDRRRMLHSHAASSEIVRRTGVDWRDLFIGAWRHADVAAVQGVAA